MDVIIAIDADDANHRAVFTVYDDSGAVVRTFTADYPSWAGYDLSNNAITITLVAPTAYYISKGPDGAIYFDNQYVDIWSEAPGASAVSTEYRWVVDSSLTSAYVVAYDELGRYATMGLDPMPPFGRFAYTDYVALTEDARAFALISTFTGTYTYTFYEFTSGGSVMTPIWSKSSLSPLPPYGVVAAEAYAVVADGSVWIAKRGYADSVPGGVFDDYLLRLSLTDDSYNAFQPFDAGDFVQRDPANTAAALFPSAPPLKNPIGKYRAFFALDDPPVFNNSGYMDVTNYGAYQTFKFVTNFAAAEANDASSAVTITLPNPDTLAFAIPDFVYGGMAVPVPFWTGLEKLIEVF